MAKLLFMSALADRSTEAPLVVALPSVVEESAAAAVYLLVKSALVLALLDASGWYASTLSTESVTCTDAHFLTSVPTHADTVSCKHKAGTCTFLHE